MKMRKKLRLPFYTVDLRRLIVLLVVIGVTITLLNSLISIYIVQKKVLTDITEEGNQAYSSKLAYTLDSFFRSAKLELVYASAEASPAVDDPARLNHLTERILGQNTIFNSVGVVNEHYIITAVSPQQLNAIGKDTREATQYLPLDRVSISPPFYSVVGNLIVMVSAPIEDTVGTFKGYIAGTIYLKKPNMLSDIMGKHFHNAITHTLIISPGGQILYDDNPDKIGSLIPSDMLSLVKDRPEGIKEVRIAGGGIGVMGYARLKTTGWTVITISEEKAIAQSILHVVKDVTMTTAPVLFLTLVLIGIAAGMIARPLHKLAECADKMDSPSVTQEINTIKAFYYEARRLRKLMKMGIGNMHEKIDELHIEAITDPLTELFNRRALEHRAGQIAEMTLSASLILLDVDHFKVINDIQGHDSGDNVLKAIADHLRSSTRCGDTIYRIGGDEFAIILPETTLEDAKAVAERLLDTRHIDAPGLKHYVTVSIGVTHFSTDKTTLEYAMKVADIALYQSKRAGRERVTCLAV